MPFPSPSDYVEAAQFPDLAFSDPDLAAGTVETNPLGLPRLITGAYAAVLRVESGDHAFAVRCFLSLDEQRRKRYRLLARHLAERPVEGVSTFEYQHRGIRVGEDLYPLLKMPWVPGEPLDRFVERHIGEPKVLLALRDRWRELLRHLAESGVAHGDLQHGNVLIDTTPDGPVLHLVDYDAMWVPALRGLKSPEVGHRNYQHPDRTEDDFGPAGDHFPGLVIFTALSALAEAPELWARFSTGENLLFRSEDFYSPSESALFEELGRIEAVAPLADALARASLGRPAEVPALEDVLAGRTPRGSRPRRRTPEQANQGRNGWATKMRIAALVGLLAAAGTAMLGWTGVGIVLALMTIAGILAWSAFEYRREPAVRRRQRLGKEFSVLEQWVGDLEDELAELDRERASFLASAGDLRARRLGELQSEALEHHLKHHFVGELAEDARVGHRGVVRLKTAGIRNAFHASAEQVEMAKGLTGEQRAGIEAWRSSLVDRYEESVPVSLSRAEEQRLRRLAERRLEKMGAEVARVQQKAVQQRAELDRVRIQLDALPRITFGRYLAHLLGGAALPRNQPTSVGRQPKNVGRVSSTSSDGSWWKGA